MPDVNRCAARAVFSPENIEIQLIHKKICVSRGCTKHHHVDHIGSGHRGLFYLRLGPTVDRRLFRLWVFVLSNGCNL